jgi:hypothetical protein
MTGDSGSMGAGSPSQQCASILGRIITYALIAALAVVIFGVMR